MVWFVKELIENIRYELRRWVVAQNNAQNIEQPSPSVEAMDIRFVGKNLTRRESTVTIDVVTGEDIHIFHLTDTNSMDPVMDIGHTLIGFKPASIDMIHVGDIIYWKKVDNLDVGSYIDALHRVVEIGADNKWFCRTKGDNNIYIDKEKIRFEDIKDKIIGVLYGSL